MLRVLNLEDTKMCFIFFSAFSILNISREHNNKSFYEGKDHICIVPAGIPNPKMDDGSWSDLNEYLVEGCKFQTIWTYLSLILTVTLSTLA